MYLVIDRQCGLERLRHGGAADEGGARLAAGLGGGLDDALLVSRQDDEQPATLDLASHGLPPHSASICIGISACQAPCSRGQPSGKSGVPVVRAAAAKLLFAALAEESAAGPSGGLEGAAHLTSSVSIRRVRQCGGPELNRHVPAKEQAAPRRPRLPVPPPPRGQGRPFGAAALPSQLGSVSADFGA